jgi:hypothetical protein
MFVLAIQKYPKTLAIYIYYAYIYIYCQSILYIYIIFSSRSIPSTVDPALLPRTDPCIAGDLDCVKSIGLSGTGQGGKSFKKWPQFGSIDVFSLILYDS